MFYKSLAIALFLFWGSSAFAMDYSELPQAVQASVSRQYHGQAIKVLSVKKVNDSFVLIIKTPSGTDKVTVNGDGKITAISDYLQGIEPSGGC